MFDFRLPLLALLCAGSVACDSTPKKYRWDGRNPIGSTSGRQPRLYGVKTTAYTHTEKDHLPFGAKSAVGTGLRYGVVRSAAADWSVYPVGTVFKIQGQPYIYQVDDYGSALVGTKTIDLYTPTPEAMKSWGSRRVNIDVLQWGSFSKSMSIMKSSQAPQVDAMKNEITQRTQRRAS